MMLFEIIHIKIDKKKEIFNYVSKCNECSSYFLAYIKKNSHFPKIILRIYFLFLSKYYAINEFI